MNPETHRNEIEHALRVLDAHAFDVKPLWRELAARTATWERGTPGEMDVRYTLPIVPPDMLNHFVNGKPQVLDVTCLWNGFSYTLTPGQRAILRDTYGLTPTQTVTCAWVEPWPGTMHPRVMKLTSDLHVDPRNRKHVLISAVIKDVGRFFFDANALDETSRAEKRFGITDASLELGRLFTLEPEERWAVEDLTGVKVTSKVEVTAVGAERFSVMCQKTGATAKVPRKEFFACVADYERAYEEDRKSARVARKVKSSDVVTLQAMLTSLGL